MEVLSMKAEKEKFAELETMLANATITQDITDDSSTSFTLEARTPTKDRTVSSSSNQHQDFLTWHHGNIQSRSQSTATSNDRRRSHDEDSLGAHRFHEAPGMADVTARIFSSSGSNSPALSAGEEAVAAAWGPGPRRRRRRTASSNAINSDDTASSHCDKYDANRRHRKSSERGERHKDAERRPTWDELIALRSQLEVARTQLNQKEVVTRSLRRQLDQRVVVDVHTHAKAEEDLVAALAKASALQEELARNSQLLVDGALVRQQLEQRCASLTQNLRATTARANELKAEVADTRAELVKVSGTLHARRNTDVVDAERLFGEELQRVQEGASRETRALKQDASGLRASLEELTAKFRKACGERDAWCQEAEAHASEAGHLRETISALRQYSESNTIDQLLGQVAHFKDRAEELERLQRQTTSSSEAATSFDSVAEADDASHFTAGTLDPVPSLPLSSPGRQEECTEADTQDNNANAEITKAENRNKSRTKRKTVEEDDIAAAVERSAAELEKLRTELVDAREALRVAGEALAEAELAAREEGTRRGMAEAKVQSLQREAEASALAARQTLVARRATKRKALEDLKVAIQEEMRNELSRLRHELEERKMSHKAPPGMDKACQAYDITTTAALTLEQSDHEPSPGVDKPSQCPIEDTAAFADKEAGQEGLFLLAVATPHRAETSTATLTSSGARADEGRRAASAGSSRALEAGITDAKHIVANGVASSDSAMVLKLEAAAKEAAAVAATTEAKATAWAQAFSAAAQLILAALASICESIRAVELSDAGERDEDDAAIKALGGSSQTVGLDDLTALLETRTDARRSSCGSLPLPEAGEDVTCAMEDLREKIALAVADIQSALIEHTAQTRSAPFPTGAVVSPATSATTGAQAEDEKEGTGQYGTGLNPAPQGSPGLHLQGVEFKDCQQRLQPDSKGVSSGENLEAPAWDGGKGGSSRHSCPNEEGDDRERGHDGQQKAEGTFVLELRREAGVLNEALSRAEREKEDLARSLARDFEQVKAIELGKLRETYEAQIRGLYSYTMAIVQEFGNDIRLTRTTGDWELPIRSEVHKLLA